MEIKFHVLMIFFNNRGFRYLLSCILSVKKIPEFSKKKKRMMLNKLKKKYKILVVTVAIYILS